MDDILQNTNRVMWREAETFKQGTNFRAWAFQIARYQVLQFREKQQREGLMIPFSEELIESLVVLAGEKESAYERRRQFLKMCLDKMPDRQREVIEKRYFEKLSVQRISEILEIKPNAVSQLLFRGRENLLHCIESQMPGESHLHPNDL